MAAASKGASKGASSGKVSGTVSRSSKTGEFVTKQYADKHKSTTETQKKKK